MGFEGNINFVEWPKYDESLISSEFKEIVVQINGKVRDTFLIDSDLGDEELIKKSKEQPKIKELIKNKKIIKEICARNKLVNLVIN
jgi:leucyl-tRNA synthetase